MEQQARTTIAQARREAGISQQLMADMLGVSRPTLSKWESNPESMTITDARNVCEKLGRDFDEIFFIRDVT